MKNILEYIRTEIAKVCEISHEVPFVCEYPRDKLHGDFATNIAMVASKIEKKSPIELAFEQLISKNNCKKFAGYWEIAENQY